MEIISGDNNALYLRPLRPVRWPGCSRLQREMRGFNGICAPWYP